MSEIFSWGKACGRYQRVFWKLVSWSFLRDFFGGLSAELKAHQIERFFSYFFPYTPYSCDADTKGWAYGKSEFVSLIPFEF